MTAQHFFDLAVNCYQNGQLEEAVAFLTKAEETNGRKYPVISYNKGVILHDLYKKSEEEEIYLFQAIESYTKAEDDNGGKYPEASCNKGNALIDLYEKQRDEKYLFQAIDSCTKAEEDNGGKFPEASCNKGIALRGLYEKQRDEKYLFQAVESYTKAEEDNGGKYPDASYNKGIALWNLYKKKGDEKYLFQAIDSCTKAEEDNGGKFPSASYNKGNGLRDLYEKQRDEKYLFQAIDSCTKAEEDNGGKFPEASCTKGSALGDLYIKSGIVKYLFQAIDSYAKAEDDNGGKFPMASYNKGAAYELLGNTQKAVQSYEKVVNDSPYKYYPTAHLALAKLYQEDKAKYHAFKALSQDSYNLEIVNFVKENFSNKNTEAIYQNRIEYLLVLSYHIINNTTTNELEDKPEILNKIISGHKSKTFDQIDYFCDLLLMEEAVLPVEISYHDRLRLAYIINYYRQKPWKTFFIVKHLLKEENLNETDKYFLLVSSFMTGESVSQLKKLTREKNIHGTFQTAYNTVSNKIISSGKEDEYLLKLNFSSPDPVNIETEKIEGHQWLKDALKHFLHHPNKPYKLPISTSSMNGIFSQAFANKTTKKLTFQQTTSKEWNNFKAQLEQKEIDFRTLLENIKEAIQNKIPYEIIINTLNQKYIEISSEKVKKIISLAMYGTIYIQHKKGFKFMNSYMIGLVSTFFSDMVYDEATKSLITPLFISIGVTSFDEIQLLDQTISYGHGLLAIRTIAFILNTVRNKSSENFLESLINEIER
ncbi:MAG: hypothetical protein WCY89_06345 [Flavobacteriaceae bacterium]